MFTPKPIGYVQSPYKRTQEVPKGLGAQHDAEGVLEILPEFDAGLKDIEGFPTSSCSGSLTAQKDLNSPLSPRVTIALMEFSRRARPCVQTRLL